MGNLETVSAATLREILDEVEGADATKRIMVAIAYTEIDGLSQNDAAAVFGFSSGWASRWFRRLERLESEPFEDVVYDESRPGRPSKLSDGQREQFRAALRGPPESVGVDAPAWTVPLARQYLRDTYDVAYSRRHVRRLMRGAGLSWKPVRRDDGQADDGSGQSIGGDAGHSRTVWTSNSRS